MSAQGHATPGDAAASHDHHYEGIPADRPAPDEPRTPLWLPLVGMGLLLLALLAYVMTRPPGKTGVELAKEAAPEASAPAAAAPAPGSAAPNPRLRRLPGLGSAFPGAFPPGAAPPGAMAPGAAPAGSAPGMPERRARPLLLDPGAARPRPAEPTPTPPAPAR